jgi:cobalamin synthase
VAAATGGRAAVAILAPCRAASTGSGPVGSRTTPLAAAAAIELVALAVAACLLAGSAVPGIAIVVGAAVAAIVLVLLARAQSGATGDAHGAAIELGFAAALVAAAILRP